MKSKVSNFYRPHIELDCKMTKNLIENDFFSSEPLTICDIGARSGFDDFWNDFGEQCIQVGFEADEKEVTRIREEYNKLKDNSKPQQIIECCALWEDCKDRIFYVAKNPYASSFYLPNEKFLKRLPDPNANEIDREIVIKTNTLDNYCDEKKVNFDIIKIDVQGGELPVLKGAIKQLKNEVIAVVAEVEFVKLYEGQSLFCEVDNFMKSQGFNLFDLDIRRWRRKKLSSEFNDIRVGQVIYGDAIYLKDPVDYDNCKDKTKLLKLACISEIFAMPDYSIEILEYAKSNKLIEDDLKNELIDLLMDNKIISINYKNEI